MHLPTSRSLIPLLAALLLPATASAYTQSLSNPTTVDGQDHILSFTGLPTAQGTVTLTVGLQGDFSYGDLSNPEGSENYADGNLLGTFIPANDVGNTGDCTGDIYTKVFTFPASYINDNNAVDIRIDLYAEVGTFCTPAEQNVYATIDYVDNTPPTVAGISDQVTNEDTAGSVNTTVSDAEDAAAALTVSATSSDTSVISTVTATNNAGTVTLSWTPVANASGTTTITLVVDDTGGGSTSTTFDVTVTPVNDPPFGDPAGPYSGSEGSPIGLDATGSTDIDDAIVSYEWDCTNDGVYEIVTNSPTNGSCTYPDDGNYVAVLRVQDAAGAYSFPVSTDVAVSNVAPTITSTAPTNADEGVQYSYSPAFSDPGSEIFAWTLGGSPPGGMTIDPNTGLVTWTPSYLQALAGSYTITITVDDGDGGSDTESATLTVTPADDDADGIDDGWELIYGLDPTDPNDAAADPDADGLTNLDEFNGGTDPGLFDGPTEPTLVDPVAGAEVTTDLPTLLWDDATDPQNDVLTYTVEVYADAGLTTLVTSASALPAGGNGQTSWTVDTNLSENTTYWWRARAADPYVEGAWAIEQAFFVNQTNDAPEAPVLTAPVGGEVVATLSPTLSWSESFDPDLDLLTYDVEVYDTGATLVASGTGIAGDGLVASWTVDVELVEDERYTWLVTPVDEHGLVGAASATEAFLVSTLDAAPSDPVFTYPEDGGVITNLSPVFEVTESIDPEGTLVDYEFEVDSVSTFDGVDYASGTTSAPEWDLSAEGITLPEHVTLYARVRAVDANGIASQPDTIEFFSRGNNDAPTVPVLLAPADGDTGVASPAFEVEDPTDPEGDTFTLEFLVASDAEMTEVIAQSEAVTPAGGSTTWTPDVALSGTVYWTARAVDEFDEASEWAEPFAYSVAVPGDDDDDDDDGGPDGCACSTEGGSSPGLLALLLLLVPVVRRRR